MELKNRVAEIQWEQAYFDAARHHQERSLEDGDRTYSAAANSKAAGVMLRAAKERRDRIDLNGPVAELSFELEDGEVFYVGKHAIHTDTADLLVIAWQSEAASSFLLANAQEPHGVTRKRQFDTTRNKVNDFDDTIYADLLARINALQMPEPSFDDALLRDLERDRTGEMQDIVKTIQSAQYDVVRAPLDHLLIVQGGPGTGKTAIALHRVSYLLFNHPELRDEDVLVVAPNPTFTRYIKALLPALGDVNVVQTNLMSLGPIPSDRRRETPEVAALKGDVRMSGLIQRALDARIRPPEDETETFPVATRSGTVMIDSGYLRDAISVARIGGTYMQGRAQIRVALAEELTRRTAGSIQASAQQVDAALDRVWPSLTAASFLRDLFGSRDRLFEAAGADFTAQEASILYRQSSERVSEETWSDADVALLDEAAANISGGPDRYRHVVVDEAQDLSPMQMRSLRRRSNGSMTVVGDLAQSTGPFARTSWDEIVLGLQQDLPAIQREFEFGYRVPRQVMELAERLLPIAAPGIASPRVVRDAPTEPQLLELDVEEHPQAAVSAARDFAGRGLSVGVIIPRSLWHLMTDEFARQGVKWNDSGAGSLGQGINLVTASESKGLEFDAVVVTSPQLIVEEDSNGFRLLYIALTRTTRYLTIVHAGNPLALGRASSEVPTKDNDDVGETSRLEATAELGSQRREATVPEVQMPSIHQRGRERSAVIALVATDLATEVRESLSPSIWPEFLNELRKQLGVSSEDVFNLLE